MRLASWYTAGGFAFRLGANTLIKVCQLELLVENKVKLFANSQTLNSLARILILQVGARLLPGGKNDQSNRSCAARKVPVASRMLRVFLLLDVCLLLLHGARAGRLLLLPSSGSVTSTSEAFLGPVALQMAMSAFAAFGQLVTSAVPAALAEQLSSKRSESTARMTTADDADENQQEVQDLMLLLQSFEATSVKVSRSAASTLGTSLAAWFAYGDWRLWQLVALLHGIGVLAKLGLLAEAENGALVEAGGSGGSVGLRGDDASSLTKGGRGRPAAAGNLPTPVGDQVLDERLSSTFRTVDGGLRARRAGTAQIAEATAAKNEEPILTTTRSQSQRFAAAEDTRAASSLLRRIFLGPMERVWATVLTLAPSTTSSGAEGSISDEENRKFENTRRLLMLNTLITNVFLYPVQSVLLPVLCKNASKEFWLQGQAWIHLAGVFGPLLSNGVIVVGTAASGRSTRTTSSAGEKLSLVMLSQSVASVCLGLLLTFVARIDAVETARLLTKSVAEESPSTTSPSTTRAVIGLVGLAWGLAVAANNAFTVYFGAFCCEREEGRRGYARVLADMLTIWSLGNAAGNWLQGELAAAGCFSTAVALGCFLASGLRMLLWQQLAKSRWQGRTGVEKGSKKS
eukprot:g5745.t1